MIVSSKYEVGHEQKDGRRFISEIHVADDGQSFPFEWLWDGKADLNEVLRLRAEQINARLAGLAAALEVVGAASIPVSIEYWRKLFTDGERQGIDKVDSNLDAFGLTNEQIDRQRTTLKTIDASRKVDPADPAIRTMLDLYASIGVLSAERIDEILGAAGKQAAAGGGKS